MKRTQYYFIWIEGFGPKDGEKVKSFNGDSPGSIEYTTRMMDALRIKKHQIPEVRERLERLQIASWVTDSPNTFVETSYAPKGTLLK